MLLIENYQGLDEGVISYASVANLAGAAGAAAVEADGDERFLRFFPANNNTHNFFGNGTGQLFNATVPCTIYMKFRLSSPNRVNTQLRVSSSNVFRVKFDTNAPFGNHPLTFWYDDALQAGDPDQPDQEVERDVWYELWLYLDGQKLPLLSEYGTNTVGRYQAYIRGGAYTDITRITIDDDDPEKYVYNNSPVNMLDMFFQGWDPNDIFHNDIYIAFKNGPHLAAPEQDRLWFNTPLGFSEWNYTDAAWKGRGKDTFEDGDHVGFYFRGGSVTITEDVTPGSIVAGWGCELIGNRGLGGEYLRVIGGDCILLGWSVDIDTEYVYIGGGADPDTGLAAAALEYRNGLLSFESEQEFHIGKGIITLDGGRLRIRRRDNFETTLTNDILVTENGGSINTARESGNPINVFSGTITLEGTLTLRSGAGGNNEETQRYDGTVVLKNDVTIRGLGAFGNGKRPVFNGPITEEGGSYQLTLSYAQSQSAGLIIRSVCTYTGGTVIEASAGHIRVADGGRLGLGDIVVKAGGRIIFDGDDAVHSDSALIVEDAAAVVTIDGSITVPDMSYAGSPLAAGTYTTAQLEDAFGDPGVFSGGGTVTVA